MKIFPARPGAQTGIQSTALLCDLLQFQDFASIPLAPANVPTAKGKKLG